MKIISKSQILCLDKNSMFLKNKLINRYKTIFITNNDSIKQCNLNYFINPYKITSFIFFRGGKQIPCRPFSRFLSGDKTVLPDSCFPSFLSLFPITSEKCAFSVFPAVSCTSPRIHFPDIFS